MAWKAKIAGVTPVVTPYRPGDEPSVQYRVTVDFYMDSSPDVVYSRNRVLAYTVTPLQVLAFIKKELAELDAGDTLPTVLGNYIGVEISANTTWP